MVVFQGCLFCDYFLASTYLAPFNINADLKCFLRFAGFAAVCTREGGFFTLSKVSGNFRRRKLQACKALLMYLEKEFPVN